MNYNIISEHMVSPNCITIYDIDGYFLDDKVLKEMNNYLIQKNFDAYFDYPHIGGGAEEIFHEMIIIGIEIVRNIGINALYDTLKYALTTVLNKVKHIDKKPAILIECNDAYLKLEYGFELNDEQKDMVVKETLKFIQDNSPKQ